MAKIVLSTNKSPFLNKIPMANQKSESFKKSSLVETKKKVLKLNIKAIKLK